MNNQRVRLAVLYSILLAFVLALIGLLFLGNDQLLKLKQVGDTLQPFAVSLGALVAALGGFNLVEDWIKRRQDRDGKIESWKQLYPAEKLGLKTGFEFIKKDNSDHIYLYDRKRKLKRHIANLETLRAVWFPDPPVRVVDDSEFEAIKKFAGSIDVTTS